MYKGKKIAVVIPTYNDHVLIRETLEGIPDFIDQVYVVDDGSTDETRKVVNDYTGERIFLMGDGSNRGAGAALILGYNQSLIDNTDIIIKMDSDNQMNPKYLPDLLEPIIEGRAEYTKGDRLSKRGYSKGMSPWRRFGNFLLTWLNRIASGNYSISDPQNGYTAISKKALKAIINQEIYPRYGYLNDILVKLSVYNIPVIDVSMPARYGTEKSKIKYHTYIPKVSWLLLRLFVWRVKRQTSK
jgi:glycosyltransferase involved in cell wall biosynthesis